MAFLTPEQIRAVRIKGSKIVMLAGIEKEIRIIKMSSGKAIESQELQQEIRQGKKSQSDMIRFMFENTLAEIDGTPITQEDAVVLFNLLPVDGLSNLVLEINQLINVPSKEPAAEPMTAAEKKG